MSIELEWDKLDSRLASSLIELLNKQLINTARPSFIGPIEVTSFEFGSASPDVELVDLRDVYRDFLDDDDDDDASSDDRDSPKKVTAWPEEDESFEWVSRRSARAPALASAEDVPAYHLLPPHMRYGPPSTMPMFSPVSSLRSPRDMWSPAMSNLVDLRPTFPSSVMYAPSYASAPPSLFPSMRPTTKQGSISSKIPLHSQSQKVSQSQAPSNSPSPLPTPDPHTTTPDKPPATPDLQLHLRITWHSNLRLTLTTSLLINYPSPMFMSLPIKLSVTGLLFTGEVVVAYEGERRRVHLCIVDELDPYAPLTGDRPRRDTGTGAHTPSSGGTPPEAETYDDAPSAGTGPARIDKPLPVGQRLLPSILIESEIGQADKHVLKNVSRVERFIQDVIRKTVEEELVFPNFHTLVLPDVQA